MSYRDRTRRLMDLRIGPVDSRSNRRYCTAAMLSSSPRLVRALIQVLCAFVLIAQQAALTHVVWHAAAAQSAQEHDRASEDERVPAPELASLCAFDAAFGQVLGATPAMHFADDFERNASQGALHRSRAYTAADSLTPRSRGPPVLL